MTAPLRINEALLIADRAFHPYQCVAWEPQNGAGHITLSVIDRTSSRLLGRMVLPGDSLQLAGLLQQSREELGRQGYPLAPWQMPVS